MSCGIAHAGMLWQAGTSPFPLPVQALDHATGYLMAAAVARALRRRLDGEIGSARLSLARTAALLQGMPANTEASPWLPPGEADFTPATEQTGWGPARRYRPPMAIAGAPVSWAHGAVKLGTSSAEWAG
jgi:crotonobetainyl-CoA:carnitine CoA-transferase CaiB-like acyl-CoA transferase